MPGLLADILDPVANTLLGTTIIDLKAANSVVVAVTPEPHKIEAGYIRYLITLNSGHVMIDYPAKLTVSDVDDLHDYFDLLIKQLKRKTK